METTDVKVFSFADYDDMRVFMKGRDPWWAAKDIAHILGYSETEAMTRRLDDEEKDTCTDSSSGQGRNITIINESGLYSAILSSQKPEAKQFKKWITSVVLPSIRETGGYLSSAVDFTDPDNIQRVLDNWKEERARRIQAENKLAIDAPKVAFFDSVTSSKDAIDMKDAAKVLNIGIGRNTLFQKLRDAKILMENNTPYQAYIDRGYFRVIESRWITPQGETKISLKTVVYQRGLYFILKEIMR